MFKMKLLTETDYNSLHPSCNICTKGIKPGRLVLEIRHNGFDGTPNWVYAHRTCVDRFFAERDILPPENAGPLPTKERVASSVMALEMV